MSDCKFTSIFWIDRYSISLLCNSGVKWAKSVCENDIQGTAGERCSNKHLKI